MDDDLASLEMIIRGFIIYITECCQIVDAFMISCCRLDLAEFHQLPSGYPKWSVEPAALPKGEHGDVKTKVGRLESAVLSNRNQELG